MIYIPDFHWPRSEGLVLRINSNEKLENKSKQINQDPFELQLNPDSN